MTFTEAEAKNKACPLRTIATPLAAAHFKGTRVTEQGLNCMGSFCMLWRAEPPMQMDESDAGKRATWEPEGSCGLVHAS